MLASEPFRHLWRHGVHDVANQSHAPHNADSRIKERNVVSVNIFASFRSGFLEQHHIVSSLGQSEEEREQERHQDNPLRKPDASCEATRQNTKHEAGRYYEYIHYRLIFQSKAICHVHKKISEDY